MQNKEKE